MDRELIEQKMNMIVSGMTAVNVNFIRSTV